MRAVRSTEEISIYFDGIFTRPQLNHPEGLAFDQQGQLWCGGETGEIFKISDDGKSIEVVTSTDGFILGMNFDSKGYLYICDLRHSKVFRYHPEKNELIDFAKPKGNVVLRNPNYPVIDEKRNVLYVSQSVPSSPGIWRFDLTTGEGDLWYTDVLEFANGLALSEDGNSLYVAETFASRVSKIHIQSDGSPSKAEIVTEVPGLPDGLILYKSHLYITNYEPSVIYRTSLDKPQPNLEKFAEDSTAHALAHPTNGVVYQKHLYIANLGRWHISRISLDE